MSKIFVLGSINMDLVISSKYHPRAGETVLGHDFMTNPGGKGANQAVTCGKLGGEVILIGAVGKDLYGKEALVNLKNSQVNIDFIKVTENVQTGVAIILLSENDNRIIVDSGANCSIDIQTLYHCLNTHGQEKDIFVTQLELPLEIVSKGLALAKEKKMYTILNPAPAINIDLDLIKNVDLLVLNEIETKTYSHIFPDNEENLFKIFAYFKSLGVKDTIVTLGDKGGVMMQDGQLVYYKPYKVNALDTTAAGDAFIGGIATELSHGKSLFDGIERAKIVAAITVTRKGAQKSIPNKKEIEDFIRRGCFN